jgi:DNA polymerase-1
MSQWSHLCKGCVYERYPKIPPSPLKGARLAIVGEAPGVIELARKKPFVGPSGELLRKTFQHVGLPNLDEVFITNALLCRPPKGQINKQAVSLCSRRLIDELVRVSPRVIIAFGNTAIHALTGDFKLKITQIQGQVLQSDLLKPCNPAIVPVLHPAAVLRAGGAFGQFVQALRRAYEVYVTGEVRKLPEPTFTVIENGAMLERAIKGLVKRPLLGGDIETHGNPRTGRILCLGVCWNEPKGTDPEPGRVLIFPEDMIPYTKPLLEHPYPKWIWQGGKYDMEWLWERGIKARLDHDTMMLHYALCEQTGTHGLDKLSVLYLGDEPYKHVVRDYSKGKKKEGFGDVPKEVLYPYLAKDVDRMVRLFHIFYPKVMSDRDLMKLYYRLLLPANRFLVKVQSRGLLVNFEELEEEDARLQEEIEQLEREIIELAAPYWDPDEYLAQTDRKTATEIFKPSSTYQLAWLLYEKLGLRAKYMKGRSTKEEVLEQLKGQHPIVDKILEYREVKKLHSTYIRGTQKWIEEDGRVHTGYKVHGTVTGRLSSSQPNVQNIPKKIRRIYHAPPGFVLIDADYSGAELRILAYVSGDKELVQIFKEGRSLHKEVAREFFGPNYTDEQYMRAKAVNFGIAYGRTAFSLSVEMDIPQEEAQSYIDRWYARFPEAHKYLLECDAAARRGEVLVTDLGRKRRFGLVTPENVDTLENEARNFRIQSLASDMTLISAIRMDPLINRWGARVVNLVHDSIVIECPITEVKRTIRLAHNIMVRTPREILKTDIPFEAEFKVGFVWGKDMMEFKVE